MISSQSGFAVYQDCLSPQTNPGFDPDYSGCDQILRNPATGNAGPIDVNYTNEGAITTAGMDIQFNWSTGLGGGHWTCDRRSPIWIR